MSLIPIKTYLVKRQDQHAQLAIHAVLTIVLGALGLCLNAAPDTFFQYSNGFAALGRFGTQHWWALVLQLFFLLGVIGIFTPSRRLRLVSVLGLSTMHGILGMSFVMAAKFTPGFCTYLPLAGLGYYLGWTRLHEGF